MDDFNNRNKNGGFGQNMTPETRQALKWGAIGAVIAIPVPFVGPVIGGLIGGGLGYARAKGKF
ncbi:hypothetical protein RM533_02735 [Croceicoccus sp. F390]|uniref:Uncharacterized protein n=1 Tax=Croceicoccus esteveae TaxID=3075597 RepID=A0ABU2ZHN0_9SPHN|nr:hypothetical protein [Croceicoccus sp. F390]MDT0575099.1 hypothetical protein [Croceicoccus sp. F390]